MAQLPAGLGEGPRGPGPQDGERKGALCTGQCPRLTVPPRDSSCACAIIFLAHRDGTRTRVRPRRSVWTARVPGERGVMRAIRTVVASGGGIAALAMLTALTVSGCSASPSAPRPAAVHSAQATTGASPSTTTASPSPTALSPRPSASPTRPATPRTTPPHTAQPGTAAAPYRKPAPTAPHTHAPTAQDGLKEDPGPRPTGQPTGPGTHPEPGSSAPGQGPSLYPPATPSGTAPPRP